MFDGVTSAAQSVQIGLAPVARMHRGAGYGPASVGAQLPMAARALVARTVAGDDPAFAASRVAGGFAMRNRRHGLVVRFGCGRVSVRAAGGSLGLSLVAWGRADSLVGLPAVPPTASANEVSYCRAGLREWYANGPLGLEQGFTLRSPPPVAGSGAVTLHLRLSGDLVPSLDHGDVEFQSGLRAPVLRYSGLSAADASGRSLQAWLELAGRELLLRIADSGARYPIVVDPYVQLAELTASDGARYHWLGVSVAISGSTIVAGSDPSHTFGTAYVFTEPATGWGNGQQTAELTASDGADAALGVSVAVSGSTIAAGAPAATVNGNVAQGAVYVFTEPTGGWVNSQQTAQLSASDGAGLGYSVAVSGSTIVAEAAEVLYVFTEPAGGWVNGHETAKLTASDGTGLGSPAISGSTIVAGGSGVLYVFNEPAGGWVNGHETAKLTASDGTGLGLTAISGSTVVAYGSAAIYVFPEPAGGWVDGHEDPQLTVSADVGLGNLATSGGTIVGGAFNATVNGNVEQGAVYVFGDVSVRVPPHVPPLAAGALEPTVIILEPGGVIEVLPGDAPGPPHVIKEDDPEEDDSESH
jgi:hypothetical protein